MRLYRVYNRLTFVKEKNGNEFVIFKMKGKKFRRVDLDRETLEWVKSGIRDVYYRREKADREVIKAIVSPEVYSYVRNVVNNVQEMQ